MRYVLSAIFLFAALMLGAQAQAKILAKDAGPGAVWIEAKGEAPLEGEETAYQKEALDRARRAALEEGGKTFIESQTQVENFETVKDQIYSYTEGLVTDVTTIRKGEAGDRYFVVIQCKVHTSDLENKWQALRALVESRGKPRVMVTISETVNGVYSRSGTAQTIIQDELLKRRIPMVDESQMKAISENDLKEAQLDQDLAKVIAIGKRFNAEIIIVGTSEARNEGVAQTYGVPLHRFNAEVQIRAVKTSNGELMSSKRASANASAREQQKAEKDCMAKAAQDISIETVRQLVSMWFFEEDRGNNITVNIDGVSYNSLRKLETALKANKKIKNVNRRSYAKKVAQIEVQAMMTPDQLVDAIMDSKAGEFDVKGTGASTIDLTAKEGDGGGE